VSVIDVKETLAVIRYSLAVKNKRTVPSPFGKQFAWNKLQRRSRPEGCWAGAQHRRL